MLFCWQFQREFRFMFRNRSHEVLKVSQRCVLNIQPVWSVCVAEIGKTSFSSSGSMLPGYQGCWLCSRSGAGPQTASQERPNKSLPLTFVGIRDLSAAKCWRQEQDWDFEKEWWTADGNTHTHTRTTWVTKRPSKANCWKNVETGTPSGSIFQTKPIWH